LLSPLESRANGVGGQNSPIFILARSSAFGKMAAKIFPEPSLLLKVRSLSRSSLCVPSLRLTFACPNAVS
jgi:hypothetical protein